VSGATAANLSALVVARHRWRLATPGTGRRRGIVISTAGAHSSIVAAAKVMDADVWMAPVRRLSARARQRVFAVVATAGTTNAGAVEDLTAAADVAAELGCWFHVDGAYGAAALCVPEARHRFAGIERSDSFCVDPHKWLFAPYDSAALLYRSPDEARVAHTQHAAYLDVLTEHPAWNPSDYAYHLTRRARGLPFWFSLAANGTDAYARAVAHGIALAADAARLVEASPVLELLQEPELSIVLFRRTGWEWEDYEAWSARLLDDGVAFVVPTWWQDRPALRCCFVNPRTTLDDVRTVLATL
jgi:glutamate/tyrosine decarboxylase-like PLP-dependent enzyme